MVRKNMEPSLFCKFKKTVKFLPLLLLSFAIASCGGSGRDSESKQRRDAETGSLSLKISIKAPKRKVAVNFAGSLNKINCAATKIDRITVQIFRGGVKEKDAGPFACLDGKASISGVKTGTITISIKGLDTAGKTIYQGDSGEKTISAGNNPVTIEMVALNNAGKWGGDVSDPANDMKWDSGVWAN